MASVCQNPYESPQPVQLANVDVSQPYPMLPWYRKSPYASILVLLGLCCSPALLAVCIIVLTGDVYFNLRDPSSGGLKKWSYGNKVVVFIILAIQIIVISANLVPYLLSQNAAGFED